MEQAVTFRSILKEKEFWLLCFLGVLMFPGTIIGETFFYRDLYLHYLPQKKLLSQLIQSGELSLWNPYLHGGQPFLAEIDFSVLYPSNLLYLVLPFYTAFNIDIVGHVIFGAAGAYCLARFTGLSVLSSALCGVVFAFCGFSLSIINLMNRMLAHPYLPWLCILWHRVLVEKKPKWFLVCVLFIAFQIFAGAPEWSLVTFALMLVWSIAGTYELKVKKRILFLILLWISAALVSAVQLIPTFEMTAVSSRAFPGSFEIFSQWSTHVERIPEMFLPNFFGRTDTLAAGDYWGTRVEDFGFPYILSIYFGVPVILLAIAGIRANYPQESKRLRYALALAALLGILFSLGRYFPLTRFLYEILPGLDRFRYPVKFLSLAIVPMSYLAAVGFERQWNSELWRPGRITLILLWVLCGLILLCFFLLNQDSFVEKFTRIFFKLLPSEILRAGLFQSFFQTLVIVFLLSLIYTIRNLRGAAWQKVAILGITTLDLMVAGKSLNPLAPVSFYEQTPDAVTLVRKEIGAGRFYRTPNPAGIVLNAPTNDVIWQYRWNQEVLSEHLGTSYGIPMIFHGDIDGLAQKRLIDLTNAVNVLPWPRRVPLLSAAGVTVIMTHEKLALQGLEPAYILRNRSNVPFFIYRNRGAVLPAARVYNLEQIKDFPATLNLLTSEKYSPETYGVTDEQLEAMSSCKEVTGSVRLLSARVRQMEYETSGKCSGYLILGLPFYKGWQVFIDGKQDRLMRMNWAFSGVQTPSGSHRVFLRYSPASVKLGAIISMSVILALVVFTVTMNYAVRKA